MPDTTEFVCTPASDLVLDWYVDKPSTTNPLARAAWTGLTGTAFLSEDNEASSGIAGISSATATYVADVGNFAVYRTTFTRSNLDRTALDAAMTDGQTFYAVLVLTDGSSGVRQFKTLTYDQAAEAETA